MQAEAPLEVQRFIAELAGQMSSAAASEAREAYSRAFGRLRSQLTLHPRGARQPSAIFESLAATARVLGESCLPLGIGVVMHMYPLCALQCVPLPLFSPAQLMRAKLLRAIRRRSLILANAGGERTAMRGAPVVARPVGGSVLIDGTFEYMSLASVADVVLFEAQLSDGRGAALCAADLAGDGVHLGGWKFEGRMRLSDTSAITFAAHRVPCGRYVIVPEGGALRCIADYQRCWFHLFIAETYLARLMRLRMHWALAPAAGLDQLRRLRTRALHLLDRWSAGSDLDPLMEATGMLKLRVSMLAQSIAAALRSRAAAQGADARALTADADELCYIRLQPTADDKIMSRLGIA